MFMLLRLWEALRAWVRVDPYHCGECGAPVSTASVLRDSTGAYCSTEHAAFGWERQQV